MTARTTMAAAALTFLGATMAAPRADAETYLTGYGGIVFGGDLASGPADDRARSTSIPRGAKKNAPEVSLRGASFQPELKVSSPRRGPAPPGAAGPRCW